jgi:hypothetical protein
MWITYPKAAANKHEVKKDALITSSGISFLRNTAALISNYQNRRSATLYCFGQSYPAAATTVFLFTVGAVGMLLFSVGMLLFCFYPGTSSQLTDITSSICAKADCAVCLFSVSW